MLENIIVNPNSGEPIYKQLQQQIVRLIVGGQVKVGDELPSVRQIAEYFTVNPMTVSRAMSQLAEQGWIERRRGQASRIAKRDSNLDTQAVQLLHRATDELIQQSKQLDVDQSSLLALIKARWEHE